MSFRRIPFQFSSSDPVERQAELEKRFGLPSSNMYVDVADPFSMGSVRSENSDSPRLQHRIPVFLEGEEYPIQSSVDRPLEKKKTPNVRVIPIEVEGAYHPASHYRTFSGPAGKARVPSSTRGEKPCLKRSVQDLPQPSTVQLNGKGPRVHNIPIQIEGITSPLKKTPCVSKNIQQPCVSNKDVNPKLEKSHNGCAVSKHSAESKNQSSPRSNVEPQPIRKTPELQEENTAESSMKKIEDVLQELEAYEKGVSEFNGNMKDKTYRYLDEMLTRCMLRLDNVDTMGDASVRSARKNAVKKVQASIDHLESKVQSEEAQSSELSLKQTDVDMPEVSENSKAEQSIEVEGRPDSHMAEVKDDSSEGGSSITVTEVGPDTESEVLQEPDVFEPNEVEMSEDQVKPDIRDLVISEEPAIEIEEVCTDVTSNISEVPEVEMAVTSPESSPVKEEVLNVCSEDMIDEQNTEDKLNVTESSAAVTELIEYETSPVKTSTG